MNIVKYLLARKNGISKQFALLWAFGVISVEVGSKELGTVYLKLSDGGRLLIGGYGEDSRLLIQPKEGNTNA